MYNYIKGLLESYGTNYICIDNNGIGYKIYVANPYSYQEGNEYKVYIYSNIKEDEYTLYGFKTPKDREFFEKLINVKGVGPKLAIPMMASNVDSLIDAIERENILYLTKFPKIGDKVARQIILDLKGKLTIEEDLFSNDNTEELLSVLEALGYKKTDIKKVLPQVNSSNPVELQVKEALKLLMR